MISRQTLQFTQSENANNAVSLPPDSKQRMLTSYVSVDSTTRYINTIFNTNHVT